LKTGLIDRMLLVAEREALRSIICINKSDLIAPGELDPVIAVYRRLRYCVVLMSALTGENLVMLRELLKGKFSVFIGQSGVGKTSILNRIQPGLDLKVQDISSGSDKGKHTTSYVSALHCDFGGVIVDTPGFRDFGLWGITSRDVTDLFREFRRYAGKCRFTPCSHIHEPVCAVKTAREQGRIADFRYENYRRIYESFSEETAPDS
ncbi:ribosome small subunit-dependent GTPase A, partial [candidate division KSB1 bacterium]